MANSSDIKIDNGMAALYQSKAKALKKGNKKRPEGVVRRTIRLVKGLKEAKKTADERIYCSAEDRRQMYSDVFHDAWAPLFDGAATAADTLWEFLYRLWYDFVGTIEAVVNFIIKILYYTGSVLLFLWDKIWDFRIWLEEHAKVLFFTFTAFIVVVILGFISYDAFSAYEYSYYGRTLGVTKNPQEVYKTIELLGDKLSENAGANVNIDVNRDMQFKRVFGANLDIDTSDDILNTLTYMKDIRVEAFAITVDGVETVILDSEEAAMAVIESVKNSGAPSVEGLVYDSIELGEEVKVEDVTVTLNSLWRQSDAVKYLRPGSANDLAEGQEANPIINVYTHGTLTWNEEVGYSTSYITDDTMYVDQIVLMQQGQPGLDTLVASVDGLNGTEIARVEESRTTVTSPVDAVYHRGTQPIPERSGTGTWIIPLKGSYTITSPYGYRGGFGVSWADFHSGTDLYQPAGSRIYAADGGVVIYAGYRGAYGNCVEISHGGNYTTLYAHCSQLLVSVGQEVAQGEVIALIGATGFVTGAHLHFEVHYNGTAIDPLSIY